MRIIFFSHYYPPEVNAPASRTSEHCRRWARAGHDVTVVTSAPNHPRGVVYPGYRNRLFQAETIDGVKVVRVWTFLAANEGFAWRTLNYLSFMVSAALAVPRLPRPDVFVSTSPQFFCGLTGLVARMMRRVPWVLEIRDLWPESIVAVGAMRKGVVIRALEWLEHMAYRKADHIVPVTDSFVPHIAARCQEPGKNGAGKNGQDKICVIKNGADLSFFTPSGDAAETRRRFGLDGRFVVAYVGTHGMAHGLDTIVEAAVLLRNDPRIGFLMVGDGAERVRLAEKAAALKLDNLCVAGQLPKADMPAIWTATDASLIVLRRSNTFTKVLPSKMFEAMAMARPIILGIEGESKALLDAAGAGIAITPESAGELARAVVRLAGDTALCERLGRQGAAYVRVHHDRALIASHYLDVLAAAASHRAPRREGVLVRAGRFIAFARHMPPGKIVRRAELGLRRRLEDHIPLFRQMRRHVATVARQDAPPRPVFAPRKHLAPTAMPGGARFTFLNRSVEMMGRVDWTAPGPGPAHQLWRMNLHYMEYLEGVDDEAWAMLVSSWIAANPAGMRGAWQDAWNSYALSLRAVVWLQELARRSGSLPEDIVRRAEASAVEQLLFLERHLETDLGGNHLMKNIKALIWASAYFSGPQAAQWRRTGLALLTRELGRQILPDGMHGERSASYHAQVFADLLECRHALGEDVFGGRLDDALAGMAQAVADLTHPDGAPALFNDSGISMAYAPAACLDTYERLSGRRPEPRAVFAFKDAGYYGLRSGDTHFVADCGRIAPDDLPAHGHGDVLSFEWSVTGDRIIVDQGVFEYAAGERRQRARAAASHNTLCFEGADQAEFFGAFRCGWRPDVDVLGYAPRTAGFMLEGAHDGFSVLPGRPRHVRRFDAAPDGLVITDRIEGTPTLPAQIAFLLHPGVEAVCSGCEATLRSGRATVQMTSSQPIAVEPAAWWPDMGVELATRRLVVRLAPGVVSAVTQFRIMERA
jgi:glycosyltransferase involved in cell wall biosynthesis